MVLFSLAIAFLSFSTISTAVTIKNLLSRDQFFRHTAAFQVYSAQPDMTTALAGSNETSDLSHGSHNEILARQYTEYFVVSKGADNTNRQDLIASFADLPCPPASQGPFSFEFNFVPQAEYSSTGQGQINVFKINGNLPPGPTYNNIDAITGSLIGTFDLPTGADANSPKLNYVNQLVCEPTISLRFGITEYSPGAGVVMYLQSNSMGLREQSG